MVRSAVFEAALTSPSARPWVQDLHPVTLVLGPSWTVCGLVMLALQQLGVQPGRKKNVTGSNIPSHLLWRAEHHENK